MLSTDTNSLDEKRKRLALMIENMRPSKSKTGKDSVSLLQELRAERENRLIKAIKGE